MMYRYYPTDSTTHFTATATKNGQFLQVKPYVAQPFSTLADWVTSLPGQPTEQDLRVSAPNLAAASGWNVPIMVRKYQIPWAKYLYSIIMEFNANLRNNEELRVAYNQLADVIDEWKDKFTTYTTCFNRARYNGVLPNQDNSLPYNSSMFYSGYNRSNVSVSSDTLATFESAVFEASRPLYAMMEQLGVLNYVREKIALEKQKGIIRQIGNYQHAIGRIQRKMNILTHQEQRLLNLIKNLRTALPVNL